MFRHARDLEFEDAARVRDEIRKLEADELGRSASVLDRKK